MNLQQYKSQKFKVYNRHWLRYFLNRTLSNPLEAFKAARRGEISSYAPFAVIGNNLVVIIVLISTFFIWLSRLVKNP